LELFGIDGGAMAGTVAKYVNRGCGAGYVAPSELGRLPEVTQPLRAGLNYAAPLALVRDYV